MTATAWAAIVAAAKPCQPDKRARARLEWVLSEYPGQTRDPATFRSERERTRRLLDKIEALIPELKGFHFDLAQGSEISPLVWTRRP